MLELDENELKGQLEKDYYTFFYFYTPLCGTCNLARKMLSVVLELVPNITIGTCNINRMPTFAQQLKIKSVPCLIIAKKGNIEKEVYAFQSVEYLYQLLTNYKKL